MKTRKNIIFTGDQLKSMKSLWRDTFEKDRMIQLGHFTWLAFWKSISWRVLTLSLMRSHKSISNKMRLAGNFATYLVRMSARHGPNYVVQYLKASQLALSRSIAGSKAVSLTEIAPGYCFPRLTRAGLPKVIPQRDRVAIARSVSSTIRFWMTLFSVYRIVATTFTLKLETITKPFTGSSYHLELYGDWFLKNTGALLSSFLTNKAAEMLRDGEFVFVTSSSPTCKISWHGAVLDVHLMLADKANHGLISAILGYLRLTGNTIIYERFSVLAAILTADRSKWLMSGKLFPISLKLLTGVFNGFGSRDPNVSTSACHQVKVDGQPPKAEKVVWGPDGFLLNLKESFLGGLAQLQFKKEPAGKVRVFAMVDFWTQSVLRPLHQLLFALLRKLPNDGTFNQDASFKRCIAKATVTGFAAGYDLSAATDRLPLFLQVKIIHALMKHIGLAKPAEIALLWSQILVDRSYHYCSQTIDQDKQVKLVKYSVGQPMGALSSWAMLALTHHLIMQLAFSLTRGPSKVWYANYEVVGDDIQIFDQDVALTYVRIMAELGVGLTMAKSVVSPKGDTIEFVKRLSHKGEDVSAISWRMALSLDNFKGRVTMALWLLRKGFSHTQRVLHLALVPSKSTVGLSYLKASTLALISSLSGKRGISIETLIMGLIDDKKVLGGVTVSNPTEISIPLSKWSKAIADFFKTQKPVNIFYKDHFERLDIEEEIEKKAKLILNYQLGLLVKKLTDRTYVRRSLVRIASTLWPLNEDNITVFENLGVWINLNIWPSLAAKLLPFEARADEMGKLKLKGLLQPKFLEATPIEKLLAMKADLEGVCAILEGIDLKERKVPLDNSLKLVKYVLDTLDSRLVPIPVGTVATSLWHSKDIL